MNGPVRAVASLVGVVVVYGVVNLFLVGGQELYHHGDKMAFDSLKQILETERASIRRAETELQAISSAINSGESEINRLKTGLIAIEGRYPGGIPSAVYTAYSRDVDRHNALARSYNASLARYKTLYAGYSAQVNRFNTMVDQANALANRVGSTWYIVPVPGVRGSH